MSRKMDTTGESEVSAKLKIYLKVHRRGCEVLVAACDAELAGKKLVDERFCLTLHKEFYMGTLVSDDEFLAYMQTATIANLFGKHTVSLAMRNGYIEKGNIIKVAGVPHAQMVVI
ncbi:MAG: DUF424 domain-containing protein [Thermoplasmata archaeon]